MRTEVSKKFDQNLEALRGFLALFVAISHVIGIHNRLHPEGSTSIFTYQPPGHLSVLLFFIISGYVIGLTNESDFTYTAITTYLKKRVVRIYPIYLIAIILSLLITEEHYAWSKIFHNLTFTQIIYTDIIKENAPSWSLCYEVLYYLLFIPIALIKINPISVVVIALSIGMTNFYFYPDFGPPLVTSSAFGFIFWSVGLLIARLFIRQKPISFSLLASSLLLLLSLSYLDVLTPFFTYRFYYLFHFDVAFPTIVDWFNTAISFYDLAFLPYGILIILNFTARGIILKKWIALALQLIPTYAIYVAFKNVNYSTHILPALVIPILLYTSSLTLFFTKTSLLERGSKNLIKLGTMLGSISYGVYIIHYPILQLLRRTSFFDVSGLSFLPRFFLFIAVVILLGYLLEKKFQYLVKRLFAS